MVQTKRKVYISESEDENGDDDHHSESTKVVGNLASEFQSTSVESNKYVELPKEKKMKMRNSTNRASGSKRQHQRLMAITEFHNIQKGGLGAMCFESDESDEYLEVEDDNLDDFIIPDEDLEAEDPTSQKLSENLVDDFEEPCSERKLERSSTSNDKDGANMLYWQINAKMDAEVGSYDNSYPRFERMIENQKDAFWVYIELLMRSFVDETFSKQISTRHQKVELYLSAKRQVENLICTHRESLLGSSVWEGRFVEELKSRPFFATNKVDSEHSGSKCEACRRGNHAADYKVVLFGPNYISEQLWTDIDIHKILPPKILLNRTDQQIVAGDDLESKQTAGKPLHWWEKSLPRFLNYSSPESQWRLSIHCKNRCQLYHSLLHYKFRLILKIRDFLERQNIFELIKVASDTQEVITQLLDSTEFAQQEHGRFESLLQSSSKKFIEENHLISRDIWSVKQRKLGDGTTKSSIQNNVTDNKNNRGDEVNRLQNQKRVGTGMQSFISDWLASGKS